jgi:Na+-driven multidrug efflux pump
MRFDQGVVGLWWGLSAGLTVVAAMLLTRFLIRSARGIEPITQHASR